MEAPLEQGQCEILLREAEEPEDAALRTGPEQRHTCFNRKHWGTLRP